MKDTTTIYEKPDKFFKKEGVIPQIIAGNTGVTADMFSEILQNNRPISVEKLDQVTAANGLPEGIFYDYFINECFIFAVPHWRRIKPFLLRCAELSRYDCIDQLLNKLLEDPRQVPAVFEMAESVFEHGWYDAALMLYHSVINGERYSQSERLAMSYYRVFRIESSKDTRKGLKAGKQFVPYRNRLPESYALDGLVGLIDIYMARNDWDSAESYIDELCNLVKNYYSGEIWLRSDFKPLKPLVYYYAKGYLYKAVCFEQYKLFDEARKTTEQYADLSWFEGLDEAGQIEVDRFKRIAQVKMLGINVKDGIRCSAQEYSKYLADNPSEILKGLPILLDSANKYKFYIDEDLDKFEDYIQFYSHSDHKGWARQKEFDLPHSPSVHTHYCAELFQKYAMYCFRKGQLTQGIIHIRNSLKYSIKVQFHHVTSNIQLFMHWYTSKKTIH